MQYTFCAKITLCWIRNETWLPDVTVTSSDTHHTESVTVFKSRLSYSLYSKRKQAHNKIYIWLIK